MRDLTLVPLGGLCNRLRALLSTRSFVDHDHELRVRVVWDVNRDCAARYDELFEDQFTPTGQFVFRKSRWFDAPAVWRHNLRLPALCRSFVYSVQRADFHSDWAAVECLAHFEKWRRVYISTGLQLCQTSPEVWRGLRPVSPLRERIDALCQRMGAHTVGVHIRRTDNMKSQSVSSPQAFEREMRAAIAANPAVCFYLATDDSALRDHFVQCFPGRVVYIRRVTPRVPHEKVWRPPWWISSSCRERNGSSVRIGVHSRTQRRSWAGFRSRLREDEKWSGLGSRRSGRSGNVGTKTKKARNCVACRERRVSREVFPNRKCGVGCGDRNFLL